MYLSGVGASDGFFFGLEGEDGDYGSVTSQLVHSKQRLSKGGYIPENLLGDNIVVIRRVQEDSRLNKVSLVALTLTAGKHLGGRVLSSLDEFQDTLVLKLVGLRTVGDLGVQRITVVCKEALERRTEDGQEGLKDTFLDVKSITYLAPSPLEGKKGRLT